MHNFYFADKWLSYFCGRFVQAPQHEISKRDISAIEIPYKDGDILLDNGRWQNVEFEREICFLPYLSEMSAHHLAKAVTEWLTLNQGYQKYKDTYNPGYFTKAYISNIDSIVRELPSLLTTKIKFNRVPWWYSEIGAKPIELEVNKAVNLRNPEKYISLPTIKITNTNTSSSSSAKANLTINGTKYILSCVAGYDYALLDGESMQYRAYKSDGTSKFINDTLPPEFSTGNNQVTVTAVSNAEISITPNWRRL